MTDSVQASPAKPHSARHGAPAGEPSTEESSVEATRRRIRQLPPEVGAVLIGAGVVGFILPGPIGTPLILAGGLVLIPRVFVGLDGWIQRKFPRTHRVGMQYVDRFIDDFERRFPPDATDGKNAAPPVDEATQQ